MDVVRKFKKDHQTMDNHHDFNIHDKREMNKMGLETYFLYNTNMYDIAIDKLIAERKTEVRKSQEEYDAWNKLKENDPEQYKKLVEQADRADIDLNEQQYKYTLDTIYNEEILLSLIEMKIIYAFKFLEICIKKLLWAAFSLKSTKDFYKWDSITKFLKDKNIEATALNGYNEVFQLKTVNNAIKHSDDYEISLKSISEFNSSERLTYKKLDTFYERIKIFPDHFLQSLISAIYSELYDFDEKKLNEITESYVLRMNKEEAMKLANKLIENYK